MNEGIENVFETLNSETYKQSVFLSALPWRLSRFLSALRLRNECCPKELELLAIELDFSLKIENLFNLITDSFA